MLKRVLVCRLQLHLQEISAYLGPWRGFSGGSDCKNLPLMQETQVWSWVEKIPWRREQLPTPIFLTGEIPGQRSLAGHSPWGCKESDTTEWLILSLSLWSFEALKQDTLFFCNSLFGHSFSQKKLFHPQENLLMWAMSLLKRITANHFLSSQQALPHNLMIYRKDNWPWACE